VDDFVARPENLVLFPLSQDGYPAWKDRSKEDIRAALQAKVVASSSRNPTLGELNTSTRTMSFTRKTMESV
jgi:hypothetical protein